jgi:glucan phosphoethanolaminetransferase (alkaline phosphatase superfamily)
MWQRIQTVFLVIAIISLIASIFLPIWTNQDAGGKTHVLYALHYTVIENDDRVTTYMPYSFTAIFAIASATLAFIEIGKYKNRMLQMKLGALNSLFLVATIGAALYFASQLIKAHQDGQYGLGMWLPGMAVLCNLLANRFIRRDEKLVRDSDRLR